MTPPLWAWAGAFAVFAVLLVADLALTRNAAGLRTAARASALWIAAALAFGGVLWLWRALDSIPAIFGVTRDLFVVFTSNAFAVLGLRALYFLLAGSVDRFAYLKQGIAVLLVFIGVKMLISPLVHLPVWVSLAVIVMVTGGAMAASVWRDRHHRRQGPEPREVLGQGAEPELRRRVRT